MSQNRHWARIFVTPEGEVVLTTRRAAKIRRRGKLCPTIKCGRVI